MEQKSRRKAADIVLTHVSDYLDEVGWKVDEEWLFRVDPMTGAMYPADTAFSIQLGRDLRMK